MYVWHRAAICGGICFVLGKITVAITDKCIHVGLIPDNACIDLRDFGINSLSKH